MIRPDDLHVIIIEPNPEIASALSKVLKVLSVKYVQQTRHPRNLQKMVGSRPFDLVILGDGFDDSTPMEALTFVQNFPATSKVPTLWLTQSSDPAASRQMIEEGVTGVLDFPLSKHQVKEALGNFFRRVRSKQIKDLICKAAFFSEFTKAEIASLTKVAILRRFQVGETILSKGEDADRFFILVQGQVEILSFPEGDTPYSLRVDSGNAFGEMSVLDGSPRSAFCIAADDCLALEIGAHIISDTGYRLRHKIFAALAVSLAQKLRKMNHFIEELHRELTARPAPAPGKQAVPEGAIKSLVATEISPPVEAEKVIEEEVNPYAMPTAQAEKVDERVNTQEEYDVLSRKINLRADFILAKIPSVIGEVLSNKLYGYLTGSKLAKFNPHALWSSKLFTPGTPRLKNALHLVVCSSEGDEAFSNAFLQLPFSHRAVGLSQTGCAGTFLGSDKAIERYLDGQCLETAIPGDLEMPIDRLWKKQETIEYLTHTIADVRAHTLFLVFDEADGKVTRRVRANFPNHQILTVVRQYGFDREDLSTFFTMPEEDLECGHLLVPKKDWGKKGFYQGQTFILPDLSPFFLGSPALDRWGYIFSTIGLVASLGPDHSGITWGSQGGAEGAVRAAKAMYGIKGAQSSKQLADAINWADE